MTYGYERRTFCLKSDATGVVLQLKRLIQEPGTLKGRYYQHTATIYPQHTVWTRKYCVLPCDKGPKSI